MEKKMDSDFYGEAVDRILEKHKFEMLLTMPESTQEVQIKDNMGLGSTVQFYVMLKGIETIIKTMQTEVGLDTAAPSWEQTVDAVLKVKYQLYCTPRRYKKQ